VGGGEEGGVGFGEGGEDLEGAGDGGAGFGEAAEVVQDGGVLEVEDGGVGVVLGVEGDRLGEQWFAGGGVAALIEGGAERAEGDGDGAAGRAESAAFDRQGAAEQGDGLVDVVALELDGGDVVERAGDLVVVGDGDGLADLEAAAVGLAGGIRVAELLEGAADVVVCGADDRVGAAEGALGEEAGALEQRERLGVATATLEGEAAIVEVADLLAGAGAVEGA